MTKRKTVLMALSSTHHGFFRGISRYAGEHGWHLQTFMAYTGKIPLGWRGDGIISFTGYRDDLAEFLKISKLPTVELTLVRDDLPFPRVAADNFKIGMQAAEYFLNRHFKNFAWAPFAEDRPNRERLEGFKETVREHGFSVSTLPTSTVSSGRPDSIDWIKSRKQLISALKKIPKPFAVFAYNDSVGTEVIDSCLEAELMVPEQVAVLGVDNDRTVCESVPVPLSSIRYDLDILAYKGAELLDQIMKGEKPPEKITRIPPRSVVTRLSTDILAMNNIEVAKALRYIWSHFDDYRLSVEEVASQTPLTSRGLSKAFKKEMRRSIHDEIIRVRMEKVTELLINTADPVALIALQTGFSSANNLFRVFRRIHQMSPGKFRKLHRENAS